MAPNSQDRQPVRVLIADDHPVVRQGLRALLKMHPEFEVCAEASTGREAIEKAKMTKPNVVLLDISMPEMSGLGAVRDLRKRPPRPEVLILTYHESEAMIVEALRAGARGYMLKSEAGTELVTALECISRHCPFFTSRVWKLILDGYPSGSAGARGGHTLSEQEIRIVRLLADGKTNKEIASIENVGPKAAERLRVTVMKKLNVGSLCDIVHYAVRNSIIPA